MTGNLSKLILDAKLQSQRTPSRIKKKKKKKAAPWHIIFKLKKIKGEKILTKPRGNFNLPIEQQR